MAVLRLKEIMKEKGISREELAQKVDVSMTTISNISTEKNYPTIPLLLSIAEAMDVDVREMFVPTKKNSIRIEKIHKVKTMLIESVQLLGEE